jgi:uncharacterized protein (DUF4415 family)
MIARKRVSKPDLPSVKRRSKGLKLNLDALDDRTLARTRDSDLEKLAAEVATKVATEVSRTILRTAAGSSSSTWVDPDDAPEWTEEQFKRADLYRGDKLVRPGRPPSGNPKLALKLRIDPDVVAHFRATGPGWQTRINDTLRRAAKLPPRKSEPIER